MAEVLRASVPREWQLAGVNFSWLPEPMIQIKILATGEQNPTEMNIIGAEAVVLLRAVNTSNNTQKSLVKRIYEYILSKGTIVGTIEGVPD